MIHVILLMIPILLNKETIHADLTKMSYTGCNGCFLDIGSSDFTKVLRANLKASPGQREECYGRIGMMVLCDPRKPKLLWDRQQQLEEDCQGEEEKWEEEQGKDDQG